MRLVTGILEVAACRKTDAVMRFGGCYAFPVLDVVVKEKEIA